MPRSRELDHLRLHLAHESTEGFSSDMRRIAQLIVNTSNNASVDLEDTKQWLRRTMSTIGTLDSQSVLDADDFVDIVRNSYIVVELVGSLEQLLSR